MAIKNKHMGKSRNFIRGSLALAVITLIGLLFSALALTDIYHNREPDLTAEWNIVRASWVCAAAFVLTASFTLLQFGEKE